MRPDVGTQAAFPKSKRKPPRTYRYDSSLAPSMEWDGQNPAREQADGLIRQILDASTLEDAKRAAEALKALGEPFLNWAGKAERLSFDVPSLPLFVHERLSTRAILETLKGHQPDRASQGTLFDLFSDPRHSVVDQTLRAYEHRDQWVNRMILGDALVVMNSLLTYEGMAGQVQMIYIDPPYGIKFGSNFQPFVRKRDVSHNDDADMTREPEMVQAYRDTWELGLHSYLTYLRDRLLVARDLLTDSGSVFVQISDDNLHHVREVMDEVFGSDNFCSVIGFVKTSGFSPKLLSNVADYLLWYSKDIAHVKYRQSYLPKSVGDEGATQYGWIEAVDGNEPRPMTADEQGSTENLLKDYRILTHGDLSAQGTSGNTESFSWNGQTFRVPNNCHWKTTTEGLQQLANASRLMSLGNSLRYKRYLNDFPVYPVSNIWTDTGTSGFADKKLYVVQTNPATIARCLLMTTDPGDLVLDPTCGSGTTAYVAEQWGRRWITIDTSRVPLALARQRLLTATFPFYQLKDEARGPAGGFEYRRKQNNRGEEVGGIVPHVTLKSIANNEPPAEEVLVDRPETVNAITRVSGPFWVEGTIPVPTEWDDASTPETAAPTDASDRGTFAERMLNVLKRSPILHLEGNRTIALRNIRPPARSMAISAEATVDMPDLANLVDEAKGTPRLFREGNPVALVFGPENGSIGERTIQEAQREAYPKGYTHLYVIGFAIQPNARLLIENAAAMGQIPATYIQATPDLMMGDLLKNLRSSQIFSVCGLPEVAVHKAEGGRVQVELLGLDVFNPTTMENDHRSGHDVPAWFLDTNYNGLSFHVCQAFFPRTSAWDSLKKALRGQYEDSVWDHLAGTTSTPFAPGDQKQAAVKVIDDRGNELLVVKALGS